MNTIYTTNEVNEIVTTIYLQIKHTTNVSVLLSWGLSGRYATIYNDMPTLALRVSGLKHKGWVMVAYDEGNDCYEVYTTNLKGVVKKHIENVYFDELGKTIDELVERGENMSDAEYLQKAMTDSRKKMMN